MKNWEMRIGSLMLLEVEKRRNVKVNLYGVGEMIFRLRVVRTGQTVTCQFGPRSPPNYFHGIEHHLQSLIERV